VASLARPGENVTGFASVAGETVAKQLGLLHETLPRLSLVEVLWIGMTQPDAAMWKDVQGSGQRLTPLRLRHLSRSRRVRPAVRRLVRPPRRSHAEHLLGSLVGRRIR
jgi:hypothetical protein